MNFTWHGNASATISNREMEKRSGIGEVCSRGLSKVPRGFEERLDLNLPFILFSRLISRISDFYVIS